MIANKGGLVGKPPVLCPTHLNLSLVINNHLLVDIHKDWLHSKRMSFNPNALFKGRHNLTNPYF